jgi:DNA-binding LacI/PurR family transcriptional regulator
VSRGIRYVVSPASGKKPGSKDVAEAAGVSRTTVSFVLNDTPNISIPESTRRRVWAAAHALGYQPFPEARALRAGRSDIVLCLLPDWPITGPVGEVLKQVSALLSTHGLTMLTHQKRPGEEVARVLGALTPAAIVAMCDLDESEVEFIERRGLELRAWMGHVPGHPDIASLRQLDIGRLQARTLSQLGHKRLAYVAPSDLRLDWFSQPRLEGARQEADALGLTVTDFRIPGEDTDALSRWLRAAVASGMSGICAYNDEVAFSVLMAALDAGIAVPDQLSVLGVDDSFISRSSRPSITTIAFDLARGAERLATLLTDLAVPETAASADRNPVMGVILRDSTAPRGAEV